MKHDLKPCPFCGSAPVVFCTGNAFPRKYYRVICKHNCCMQSKLFSSEADAVMMWNRRAEDDSNPVSIVNAMICERVGK